MASAGLVEQRAVLGHNKVAAGELGERALQVGELATGDQDQAATRVLEPADRGNGVGIDHAVMRERAIIVGGQGQKIQRLIPRAVGSGRGNVSGSEAVPARSNASWKSPCERCHRQ